MICAWELWIHQHQQWQAVFKAENPLDSFPWFLSLRDGVPSLCHSFCIFVFQIIAKPSYLDSSVHPLQMNHSVIIKIVCLCLPHFLWCCYATKSQYNVLVSPTHFQKPQKQKCWKRRWVCKYHRKFPCQEHHVSLVQSSQYWEDQRMQSCKLHPTNTVESCLVKIGWWNPAIFFLKSEILWLQSALTTFCTCLAASCCWLNFWKTRMKYWCLPFFPNLYQGFRGFFLFRKSFSLQTCPWCYVGPGEHCSTQDWYCEVFPCGRERIIQPVYSF